MWEQVGVTAAGAWGPCGGTLPVPPCRGRAAAAPQLTGTARDGAVEGAVDSTAVFPPHPGLCVLSRKMMDQGEPGVACRKAIRKLFSPTPSSPQPSQGMRC